MSEPVRFQVDSRLATLLGENYRSSEQAIKELVDNAWDAEAIEVNITLPDPLEGGCIQIVDNGSGMTTRELTGEYLVVANDRRSRKGERTPIKSRLVKGRKGIGKFAGLMAADVMEVETRARGVVTRLRISKEDLLAADNDIERIDLPCQTESCKPTEHGTTITLSSLNQNLHFPNPDRLKQLLILEYGRQADFKILVDKEPLGIDDIPGESFAEEIELPNVGKIRLHFIVADGRTNLKQSGIAIRVGGKIVGRPSYFGLDQVDHIPEKLLRKVYGEIEADGLIEDVTADWGAIIENSKAFEQVREWTGSLVQDKVEKVFAQEVSLAKARLQKEINRGLERIPEYRREFARMAFERVMRRFYGESEERIGVILSVILEGFERDDYWLIMQRIDDATRRDIGAFAEALESFGLLDMALMAQQAKRRLELLDELDSLIRNPNTLEKTVHSVIEKNLWVIGIEYSLMSSNKTLARMVEEYTNTEFIGERASKRPDLFLSQDLYSNYLLIEFKRPSHVLSRDDENQAEKYRDDLTARFGKISILLLGKERQQTISNYYDRDDIKVLSYSSLVSRARTQLQWLVRQLTTSE